MADNTKGEAKPLTVAQLYQVNDFLTTFLAGLGWVAKTESDYEALNDLTHKVGAEVAAFSAPTQKEASTS